MEKKEYIRTKSEKTIKGRHMREIMKSKEEITEECCTNTSGGFNIRNLHYILSNFI